MENNNEEYTIDLQELSDEYGVVLPEEDKKQKEIALEKLRADRRRWMKTYNKNGRIYEHTTSSSSEIFTNRKRKS